MLLAVRQVRERIERLEQAMREAVADWTLRRSSRRCRPCAASTWSGRSRSWPSLAICHASRTAPVDGVSWPHPVREIDRRECQARRHHQGRQHPCTPAAHRGRVELPIPATRLYCRPGSGPRHGQPARLPGRRRCGSVDARSALDSPNQTLGSPGSVRAALAFGHASPLPGKRTVKTEPLPGSLATVTSPPSCARACG